MTNSGLPLPPDPVFDPTTGQWPSQSAWAPATTGQLIDFVPITITTSTSLGRAMSLGFGFSSMVLPDGSVLDLPVNNHIFPAGFIGWGMWPTDSQYSEGCAVQAQSYWQQLVELSIGPGIEETYSQALTYGTSTSQTTTLSATVGATAGLSGHGASIGLSASLTKSFADTVTISEQATTTVQSQFPVNDSESQIGAVYQLVQVFSLLPSSNLVNGLRTVNASDGPPGVVVYGVSAPYSYPTEAYKAISVVVSS